MNDTNPRVSIVIPVYNGANYLSEAIESALNQTYSDVEIIVVNDGSTDGGETAAVAAEYGDRIRYIEKENGGSSSALNRGIQEMTGEWFSWLSHDDLYYPQKIEKQLAYLYALELSDNEMKKQVLFSGAEEIDGTGKLIRRPTEKQIEAAYLRMKEAKGNEYLIAEPTKNVTHGCTCLIHRDAFTQIGMFDESLKLLNDMDMWFRLFSSGYSIHYVPEVLVKGRIHAKQVSRRIGFSYHNSEQDMYWKRIIDWLEENYSDEYELFVLYGKNAFQKTRNVEAERAFSIAASIRPDTRVSLCIRQCVYKIWAYFWAMCKSIYIKCMCRCKG